MSLAQRDRLAHVDLRLQFFGEVRRGDLVGRFEIQTAAATRDLSAYREMAPENMTLDGGTRAYRRTDRFQPLFDHSASRVLAWLTEGAGDAAPARGRSLVPSASAIAPQAIRLDVLGALTRAMHQGQIVRITYRSLTSGLTTREVAPLALANDGHRWHIRAYDRRSMAFRDFVIARIADAEASPSVRHDHEALDQDAQWQRLVDLEFVPHPANIQHPDTIEAEFGMEAGVLEVRVRAAVAGYLLRRMNVDCSIDHRLRGPEYHLWLRNRPMLVGVENLSLAPGYGGE
ncbi:transcriptional regulator [Methylibium rhizosphaerae]|uniref:transcriptional regulator n=1 Tax=Methylibium rhizosphaerae TaxID=2570323 RepID=UPI00112E6A2E|nr:WYL domain-containing protein [Methylibium rhizosphaerae]